jgi:anti-sigma factor RsiW
MDCKFTEQVSLLIDGELSADEARQIESHLTGCAICQRAREEFLLMRQEIQAYRPQLDLSVRRQALESLLQGNRPPFWRRKIALPVPAFALLLLAFVAFAVWAISSRNRAPQPAVKGTEFGSRAIIEPVEPVARGYDLSKFDQGQRAVIYKTTRTPEGRVQQ